MEYRAVKQIPLLEKVEKKMREIGVGSFLGSDSRKLTEILNEDQEMVNALDLTHEVIADRLEDITRAAKKELGDVVFLEHRYEVIAEEVRGVIPCPWGHPSGLFNKSHVELKDLQSGAVLTWTDLGIHLIRAHGFYQGEGSPYRLAPTTIKQVLF